MISTRCQSAADDRIAALAAARTTLHRACPGAVVDSRSGGLAPCECECHANDDRSLPDRALGRLLERADSSAGAEPPAGAKPPKKGAQRPKRPTSAPAGRCEHCGAPTGGRFAPGHDAKLKAELRDAAERGSTGAWAELVLRDWTHLVAWEHIAPRTIEAGDRLAKERGYIFVELRNRTRQTRSGLPAT